jgi:hypothetical protein
MRCPIPSSCGGVGGRNHFGVSKIPRSDLRPTPSTVHRLQSLFTGGGIQGMTLATQLHLVLRMGGSIIQLCVYCMELWTGATLPFIYPFQWTRPFRYSSLCHPPIPPDPTSHTRVALGRKRTMIPCAMWRYRQPLQRKKCGPSITLYYLSVISCAFPAYFSLFIYLDSRL